MEFNIYKEQVETNFRGLLQEINKSIFPIVYGLTNTLCCATVLTITSIPPITCLAFIHTAFILNQLVAPLFLAAEDYRNLSLVPLSITICHLTLSTLMARSLCGLFFKKLSLTQTVVSSAIFLIALYISKEIAPSLRSKI